MSKLLMSKKDAAEALGLSLRTVDNLILQKELTARRVGRRVLIPVAELERFTRRDHQTQSATKGLLHTAGSPEMPSETEASNNG